MRCYAPDTARGANSAPQTSWLDFGRGKERERGKNGKGGKGKGERGRKGKNKGRKERKRKHREGRRRKGKERKEKKWREEGKGRILCSCDFSLRKTMAHDIVLLKGPNWATAACRLLPGIHQATPTQYGNGSLGHSALLSACRIRIFLWLLICWTTSQ